MLMIVKPYKHDMHELNITILNKVVASNDVPTIMSIMTFSAFANIDCCLDFNTFSRAAVRVGIDEVRIPLVMVMLVR